MKDLGKFNLLGLTIDALDYDAAVARIIEHARASRPYAVTALAVHGVMTGVTDSEHRYRLNHLDMVTPDGQPVRWGLNLLHRTGLRDRVYGPTLTLQLCAVAAQEKLPLFLYGSTEPTLVRLVANLTAWFPGLQIAGYEASKFRSTTVEEKRSIAERIRSSAARIVLVGLGCPRQEVFAYEYRDAVGVPLVAVGAAFDYHSGRLKQPPAFMQRWGLQWLSRLVHEPRRLWRRYLLYNPAFLALLALQLVRLWRPDPDDARPPGSEALYG